jgi:nucleotide-binding universal stress UspA family protein
MRILAPFDQSHRSQATIPLLCQLAGLSQAQVEVTLLSVAHAPIGTRLQQSVRDGVTVALYTEVLPVPLPDIEPHAAESEGQASERVLDRLHDYLLEIAGRLPSGIRVNTEAYISDGPRIAITDCARHRAVDVIVMATRSRPRTSRLLFGSTTEAIVDSGVAPTLVVHPHSGLMRERIDPEPHQTRRERLALSLFDGSRS